MILAMTLCSGELLLPIPEKLCINQIVNDALICGFPLVAVHLKFRASNPKEGK